MRSALITTSALLVLSSVTAVPVTPERQSGTEQLIARGGAGKEMDIGEDAMYGHVQRERKEDTSNKELALLWGGFGAVVGGAIGAVVCAGMPRCAGFFRSSRWGYLKPTQWLGLRRSVPVHHNADLQEEVLQPHLIVGNAAAHHQGAVAQPLGAQGVAPAQAPPQQ